MADHSALMVIVCACGQKMKVPESSLGKIFKCVRCGEHVQVREDNLVPPAGAPGEKRKSDSASAQEPVGQLLIRAGLIQAQDLQSALEKQRESGGKTFDILIRQGKLDKEALHRFLSKQPGIAAIDLSRLSIDRNLLELIPKTLALEHLVLPVDRLGKLLTVAMACPLDAFTIAELESITGLKVKAMLCRLEDIHDAVKKYYPERAEENAAFYEKLLAKTAPSERREPVPDVRKILSLHGSQKVLQRLKDQVGQPKPDARDVAALLLQDPALAAFVLGRANSAVYGLPGKVETAPMAVAVLGLPALARLTEQLPAAAENKNGALPDLLAERGRTLAAIAAGLAEASGRVSPRLAETAGLLAEIGRYVLADQNPDRYAKSFGALQGAALAQAEQKTFSTNYAETGAALALAWRLPEVLSRALLNQLVELGQDAAENDLSRIVGLSIRVMASPKSELAFCLQKDQATLEALELTTATVLAVVGPMKIDTN